MTAVSGGTVRLSVGAVQRLAERALVAHGCGPAHAAAVAAVVAAAERDGQRSHGLYRLPAYVDSLKTGLADGRAAPTVTREAAAVVRVHGHRCFAPYALQAGVELAVAAAREAGACALVLNQVSHIHALAYDVEPFARRQLAALAMTSNFPWVAPAVGARALFGTNPLAFGWPRPAGGAPLIFDQSLAARARGDLELAARAGETLPEEGGPYGVDASGRATRDPAAILAGGAQLPFGGYKGAHLVLMCELLCGPLIADALSIDAEGAAGAGGGGRDGVPPLGGVLILLLDPAKLGARTAEAAGAHAERLFARLARDGGPAYRLPGSRALAARRAALERAEQAGPAEGPPARASAAGSDGGGGRASGDADRGGGGAADGAPLAGIVEVDARTYLVALRLADGAEIYKY